MSLFVWKLDLLCISICMSSVCDVCGSVVNCWMNVCLCVLNRLL